MAYSVHLTFLDHLFTPSPSKMYLIIFVQWKRNYCTVLKEDFLHVMQANWLNVDNFLCPKYIFKQFNFNPHNPIQKTRVFSRETTSHFKKNANLIILTTNACLFLPLLLVYSLSCDTVHITRVMLWSRQSPAHCLQKERAKTTC